MKNLVPLSGAGRVAGAAALIAVLTVASRLAGFGRTAVFTWAVGTTDLGDIYLAANFVPNIIFEIVAGGALASLVVPLLAGAIDEDDRRMVGATSSALLTWALTLLVPLAVLVAVAAEPIVAVLAPDAAPPGQVAAGARMLRMFAPQLPLYGIGIVLTGVLQAHRRFAWPVIAPLLSSVTVIGVYLAFVALEGRRADLGQASTGGQVLLALGTTGGVVVLSLCLLIPLRQLKLRIRPTYAFDGQARSAVGGLALAGAVTVGGQQIALLVTMKLALAGSAGSLVVYNLAQTVYLLPWAVLAVPLATAAYPSLASARAAEDEPAFRATLAGTSRGIMLLSCLGAAVLVAVARPVADFFVEPDQAGVTAAAIAGFAPGLIGYGLFALLTRALYAYGRARAAGTATVIGWLGVALAAVLFALIFSGKSRVLALALGNSVGMLLMGGLLIIAILATTGARALAGLARAGFTGIAAGVASALGGLIVTGWLIAAEPTPTQMGSVLQGMLSAVAVAVAFVAVAYVLDRHDVEPLLTGLARRVRSAAGTGAAHRYATSPDATNPEQAREEGYGEREE